MYQIKPLQIQNAKQLGLTIKPSNRSKYKIDIFMNGEYITSGGDIRYKDYATHLEEKGQYFADHRRRLYRARHRKEIENPNTRGYIIAKILW